MPQQVGKRIGADFEAVAKDGVRIRGSRCDGAGNGPHHGLVWRGRPGRVGKRAEKAEQEGIASLVPFQVTRWFTGDFRKAASQTTQACVDVVACIDGGRQRHRQALPGKIAVARRIAGSGGESCRRESRVGMSVCSTGQGAWNIIYETAE